MWKLLLLVFCFRTIVHDSDNYLISIVELVCFQVLLLSKPPHLDQPLPRHMPEDLAQECNHFFPDPIINRHICSQHVEELLTLIHLDGHFSQSVFFVQRAILALIIFQDSYRHAHLFLNYANLDKLFPTVGLKNSIFLLT